MKKAVISCIIAVVVIILGVVLAFVSNVKVNTDFAKGTQIEIAFNKVVTEEEFNELSSDLCKAIESKGYVVEYSRALRTVKNITGVRFVLVGEAKDFSEIASADMTLTSNVVYPTNEQSIWTIAWVLAIALAVVFIYSCIENRKARPFVSGLTVVVITILSVLLAASLYIILGLVFELYISLLAICGLAFVAAFAALASVVSVRDAKKSICSCKWMVPTAIISALGMIALGVFGYVSVMVIGLIGIVVALFTSVCITVPYIKSLTENK